MTEITVGSVAFFDGMEGFKPQVTDKVVIVKKVPNGWWHHKQTKQHVRLFEWQEHTVSELVAKLTQCTDCKRVTTLLVPEFAQAVGCDNIATYLTTIKPAIDRLCDRHAWGRIIYDAYVSNGALTITDEQRQAAFEQYKAARPEKKEGKPAAE